MFEMAEEAREVARKTKDDATKLKALNDAQKAGGMACRHRDRSTGNTGAE